MNRSLRILLVFFTALSVFKSYNVAAQTTLYDLNTLQKIEIFFSIPDWDYRMDTAKYGSEGYTMADYVIINGITFDSVGIKYKGNSSFDSTRVKNPLHIELDAYKNQAYQGIKDIKLGNGYADPSLIREVLAYKILENYMECPRANFAQVYINGNYVGLYSNEESINKQFLSNHFFSSNKTFIKCNPIVNPGPASKSNLKYISTDSTQYFNFYEIKSNYGWNNLVNLCDTVTNYPASIGTVVDIDRAIWMLAFNNVLINLDSYSGAFCQNYYLYKDATLRYNPIIWDLNMSFGSFSFLGAGSGSLATLTVTNMQQLPLNIHSTDNYWPLIKNIMSDATYKRMYAAHVRTITNEFFANNAYQTLATQLQTTVDTAAASDNNKFYTYTQFQNGLTGNVISGSYTIPGIANLMGPRVTFLQSTADFTNTAPTISSVTPGSTSPLIGSSVSITAQVINTNTNGVYLGYRFANTQKFTRILMYDDGLHNDGAAGDNVYGATFTMSNLQAQYYIYAENANCGMFSPERAEHEFYTLNASISVTTAGQVVINEFLAINSTGIQDEAGQREDWIELYNNTSTALDLYGLYLSDSYSNPTKFAFPANTVIQPHGYLLIWADEDPSTTSYLHANFKLSGSGEQLMLSNFSGTVLDSITFGVQTADVAIGRCANGTGSFTSIVPPTPEALNCVTGIEEKTNENNIAVYPNPANDFAIVEFNSKNKQNNIRVTDAIGNVIYETTSTENKELINTSGFTPGLYFLTVNNTQTVKLQVIK
jgi:hypothetical protein